MRKNVKDAEDPLPLVQMMIWKRKTMFQKNGSRWDSKMDRKMNQSRLKGEVDLVKNNK